MRAPAGVKEHDDAGLQAVAYRRKMGRSNPSAGASTAGIHHDACSDEALEGNLIDAGGVLVEVIGGVDVGAALRAHGDGQQVETVGGNGAVWRECDGGVTRVYLGRTGQWDREIDDSTYLHEQGFLHNGHTSVYIRDDPLIAVGHTHRLIRSPKESP